jgi:hypothetical protein
LIIQTVGAATLLLTRFVEQCFFVFKVANSSNKISYFLPFFSLRCDPEDGKGLCCAWGGRGEVGAGRNTARESLANKFQDKALFGQLATLFGFLYILRVMGGRAGCVFRVCRV